MTAGSTAFASITLFSSLATIEANTIIITTISNMVGGYEEGRRGCELPASRNKQQQGEQAPSPTPSPPRCFWSCLIPHYSWNEHIYTCPNSGTTLYMIEVGRGGSGEVFLAQRSMVPNGGERLCRVRHNCTHSIFHSLHCWIANARDEHIRAGSGGCRKVAAPLYFDAAGE